MRMGFKRSVVSLFFILALAAPAAAQPHIDASGNGSYNVSADMAADVKKFDSGIYTVNITSDSTLTGDIGKVFVEGTLRIDMEQGSSVVGTATASYRNNTVDITGGTITSASGNDVFVVVNGGSINLMGTSAQANGANLINATSATFVSYTSSVLANDALLIGDISNEAIGGALGVTLGNGSVLEGAVSTNAGGATNLSIASSADSWIVSGNSDLGHGSLENSGVVSLMGADDYITLKAGGLSSNGMVKKSGGSNPDSARDGIFGIRMDIVAEAGDKLEIANSAAGSYVITAQENDASARTSGRESFSLVEIGGNSRAYFALTHEIELGAWMYTLRESSIGTRSVWGIGSNGLSNVASAAVNSIAAGYLMDYAETGTLMQRMGDLRGTPMLSGFWARVHGGKFNTGDMTHGKEFDLKYGGIHIGYDRKIETGLPGDFYAGVMFGYSKGEIDFSYAGGDGDVGSRMIGVYGTYKQKNGVYVDALLKYQWIDHDFDTFDSTGARVTTNDATTSGVGFSVETGQKFAFDNGWYAAPQLRLSYTRQNDGYFNPSNGLRIGVDGYTSLIGRVGVMIGYENEKHNFYATVSRAREFDGDLDFYANTMPIGDSMGDSWWVYGIGYTAKLDDKNHLYIDVERASGGVFEQDWSVKAGWRIEF